MGLMAIDRASVGALAGHWQGGRGRLRRRPCEWSRRAPGSGAWASPVPPRREGIYDGRLADCDKTARQLSPGHAEAALNRGLPSLALDDFLSRHLPTSTALDPRQGRDHLPRPSPPPAAPELCQRARSEAHRRLGDLDGAVADLDATLRLDPDDAAEALASHRAASHAARPRACPGPSPTSIGLSPSVAAMPTSTGTAATLLTDSPSPRRSESSALSWLPRQGRIAMEQGNRVQLGRGLWPGVSGGCTLKESFRPMCRTYGE